MNEAVVVIPPFWGIFSFSFLIALTGAMAPGPLFTYTIIKSIQARNRGYLVGAWVILGHAILETGIIIVLLSGFAFILKNTIVVRMIGVTGGLILIYFGGSIIKDVRQGQIPTDFLHSEKLETIQEQQEELPTEKRKMMDNTIIGGIMVSMSNPYWWVWWASIGLAFMLQFEISFQTWPRLLAFFLGHEAGDLAWYLLVSTLAYFGLRRLNRRAYYTVLTICAVFMILFGTYLGISPFFK